MCLMPVVYVVLTGKIKPQVRPNYVRTAPVLSELTFLFSIFFSIYSYLSVNWGQQNFRHGQPINHINLICQIVVNLKYMKLKNFEVNSNFEGLTLIFS